MEAVRHAVRSWIGGGTYREWQEALAPVVRAASRIGAEEVLLAGRVLCVGSAERGWLVRRLPLSGAGLSAALGIPLADLVGLFLPGGDPGVPPVDPGQELVCVSWDPESAVVSWVFAEHTGSTRARPAGDLPVGLAWSPDAVAAGTFDLEELVDAVRSVPGARVKMAILPPGENGDGADLAAAADAAESSGTAGRTAALWSGVLGRVPNTPAIGRCGTSLWEIPADLLAEIAEPRAAAMVLTGGGVVFQGSDLVLELPRL